MSCDWVVSVGWLHACASNSLHATLFSLTCSYHGSDGGIGSCVAYLIFGIRVAIEDDSIQALIFVGVLEDFKVIHVSRNSYSCNGYRGTCVFTVLMDAVHAVNMGAMPRLFLIFWLP